MNTAYIEKILAEPIQITLVLIQSPAFLRHLDVYARVPGALRWLGLIEPSRITHDNIDALVKATYTGRGDAKEYSYLLLRYDNMPTNEYLHKNTPAPYIG